jgi:hypothetical protein
MLPKPSSFYQQMSCYQSELHKPVIAWHGSNRKEDNLGMSINYHFIFL